MQEDALKPPLIESLLRGLAALLVTPFLLLAAIAIGAWLHAQGKRRIGKLPARLCADPAYWPDPAN